MAGVRLIVASLAGALVAAATFGAPAFGAPESLVRSIHHASAAPSAGFGAFTPAAADPRLAAAMARSGLDVDGFRFTPADTRRAAHAVTVAVRSRTIRSVPTLDRPAAAVPQTVGLAPIAYNLGLAVGWKRFAIAGDLAHVDLAGQPGGRDSADVGVTYSVKRFTARVRGNVDRPLAETPRLAQEAPSYSLDVGGAYRLTRNVDLTAGVRYRVEQQRLEQPEDARRDSRAVYVGTAFRF